MKIYKNGEIQSMKGPDEWFTGDVIVDPLYQNIENVTKGAAALVTFAPGARTAWHTHPAGQTLIVQSGLGWIQKEGGPIEEIRPGDIVYFEPNEKHWHGASANKAMSHIAIQEEVNGEVVTWMEKVSDEQYSK
ncbi:cupin domain-containing protein [Mangrovimonas sp. AS39]|uniref:(R)-mandelonitrile lyase n=1 Tax=Mangrovimonas futianensis TaxID=2895523 RepID=UPI001E38E52B|nr:cupin domain-containing protein [Mangrovimonas futianensis]MCF1192231.1 cupin domain-containing protein [Mangrovimonas futianensis]MCF1196020.1 cupin domain-containing protein [Mangrovimonas futianensis]